MSGIASTSFIDAAKALAPQIRASADEIERTRRLPSALVEAIAQAGLFRLWIPRTLGGEETDPMSLVGSSKKLRVPTVPQGGAWQSAASTAPFAKQATELMFSAGGSASAYTSSGLERCVRDIHAAAQHVTLASPNYEMAGQALLGADMRSSLLLAMDERGAG
jgi:hypothetical protein